MATLSEKKICLLWYQITNNGTPNEGSAWNNDTRASPDDLVGGIPFDTGACLSEPMYLTACGTGDASVQMGFGPAEFFIEAVIPRTYTPGWPNGGGGYDTFDAASLQGSASFHSGSPIWIDFPTSPGVARSVTGWTRGRFFVQYKLHYDIFSQQAGAGIMRAGALLNFAQQGKQNGSDIIGGAMVQGGDIGQVPPYQTQINAFGVAGAQDPLVSAPDGSIISLAIALVPQFQYVPTPYQMVKLPDLICCPVARRSATARIRNRSGQS